MNVKRLKIEEININDFVKLIDANFDVKYQNHTKEVTIMMGENYDGWLGSFNPFSFIIKNENDYIVLDIVFSVSRRYYFDFRTKNKFYDKVWEVVERNSKRLNFTFEILKEA